jgi:hypothetical protein
MPKITINMLVIPVDLPDEDRTIRTPGIEGHNASIYFLKGMWYYEDVYGDVRRSKSLTTIIEKALDKIE